MENIIPTILDVMSRIFGTMESINNVVSIIWKVFRIVADAMIWIIGVVGTVTGFLQGFLG